MVLLRMSETNNTSLSSIEKAFRIIYEFSVDKPEKGVIELAESTRLPSSTVHRILKLLKKENILDQDESSKKYRLGLNFLSFSKIVTTHSESHKEAYPIYIKLANELGTTVHVSALREGKVTCLLSFECVDGKNIFANYGKFDEIHCTSEGKVLLAFGGIKYPNRAYPRFTRYTI